MSLLYLLVNDDASAVKVGVSIDPRSRAAQLPTSINLEQSLEIEFREGSAGHVERILHYLFREHKQRMPPGDGHTEWFRLEVMHEIVQFLRNEGKRLGVSGIRSLHSEAAVQAESARKAIHEAKALKVEARRLRQEQRAAEYAVALAVAAEHNARVLDWIRTKFREMDSADLILGILPPKTRGGYQSGSLYLRGKGCSPAAKELISELSTLHTPGGGSRVFSGSFSDSKSARVTVSGELLNPICGDYDRHFPGAEPIRTLLRTRTAEIGSPQHDALLKLQTKMLAQETRFMRGVHKAWDGAWNDSLPGRVPSL